MIAIHQYTLPTPPSVSYPIAFATSHPIFKILINNQSMISIALYTCICGPPLGHKQIMSSYITKEE